MPRPKNQAARRGQLKQAAKRAIAARGIEGVRIKDVAIEAGLSPQSVLYYYPELDTLIEEAIQHVVERFAERRRETADGIGDPRAALVAMIKAGLPTGPDDEDLRITYDAAGYFRVADSSQAIARNLVALEDAYGLYMISGGEIAEEALGMLLSFASMATGCRLEP